VKPIRETLLGLAESGNAQKRQKWLQQMAELGRKGV
jgi:hypothetical protein